jgi:hypothetical protein
VRTNEWEWLVRLLTHAGESFEVTWPITIEDEEALYRLEELGFLSLEPANDVGQERVRTLQISFARHLIEERTEPLRSCVTLTAPRSTWSILEGLNLFLRMTKACRPVPESSPVDETEASLATTSSTGPQGLEP